MTITSANGVLTRCDPPLLESVETTPEPAESESGGEPVRDDRPDGAATTSVDLPSVPTGYTKKVASAESDLAEAERLAAIAEDRAEVPSPTAFAQRRKTRDAAARRAERNNPDRVALRDSRARLFMNLFGLLGAVIALGWSTANVQATAALGVGPWSAGWWLAWGVEPLITTSLVTVMGATAYLASRGVLVTNRWVSAAKWVPLGYTVALNCWTSLPSSWLAHPAVEFARGVIVHSVGPVVVVLLAHSLPVLWGQFVSLDHAESRTCRDGSDREKHAVDLGDEVDTVRGAALLAEMAPAGPVSSYAVRKWGRQKGHRIGARLSTWMAERTKTDTTGVA